MTAHATLEVSPANPGLFPCDADDTRERLSAYLGAYWLRPENALWMTLRSMALAAVPIARPTADLSCGDGIFTFLHLGGRLAEDFDVFTAASNLDRVTHEHADMFDHVPRDYRPPISTRPSMTVSLGTDLKPAMLAKAAALRFYDALIQHDSNQRLPIDDAALATVYCNSAYWIRDIDGFLRDLHRVVQPDGVIVLHVKLADMQRYTFASQRNLLGQRWLDIIGRGRMECWPTVCGRSEWEQRFRSAGLDIREATPFVTSTHARIWDIGLRPIAPLLVRMTQALTPATRAEIKRDWVELMLDLLMPLCRPDLNLSGKAEEPAEMQYVLTARP